jgi:hypothetical protein
MAAREAHLLGKPRRALMLNHEKGPEMDQPEVLLETRYGMIRALVLADDHVHVSAGSRGVGDFIVNGVHYTLDWSLHRNGERWDGWKRLPDGGRRMTYRSMQRKHWSDFNRSHATAAAWRAVDHEIPGVVGRYFATASGASLARQAEALRRQRLLEQLHAQRQELIERLREVDEQINEALIAVSGLQAERNPSA